MSPKVSSGRLGFESLSRHSVGNIGHHVPETNGMSLDDIELKMQKHSHAKSRGHEESCNVGCNEWQMYITMSSSPPPIKKTEKARR
jgi:hypothetical protein